jgi:hypothetical protein
MEQAIKEITELGREYDLKIEKSENIYERLELTQAAIAVQKCLQIVIRINHDSILNERKG